MLRISVAGTVSIESKVALAIPEVSPLSTTLETSTPTVSVRSKSVRVKVSLTLKPAFVSVKVAAALSPVSTVISGVSLVPLIVITTFCVSVAFSLSVAVNV